MASVVIKGVYTSKSALDTAEKATASAGDTYIVGSKIPYDLYTFTSGSFVKGDKVSDTASDLTKDIPVSDLYDLAFTGDDGKTLKIRKGLHIGEIHFYVPSA